ncbi:hypothetical protein [Streptomyces hydrogenans]|uniref:Uncharacterized protein n=1 Tax=Streptomyces hydrogenans TaxID=1873719 RepID=A0ABQ3PJS4_9ACTN|nr:hypothetical protein [Streptomyces hydrogenans]GHG09727.1 hypothetical protein GCM10018784_22910 [Streptomyces hydrogenans]GHI25257.1 hypothetical protein Shyd_66280 [Streptomyces hydrogenans]
MTTIYVSRSSFTTVLDGIPIVVRRGATVREGHPLLAQHPELFGVYKPDFEYTPPAPEPEPEKRVPPPSPPAKKAAPALPKRRPSEE